MSCQNCICRKLKNLNEKVNNIIQPFVLHKNYYVGDKIGMDMFLYVCIKDNYSTDEITPFNTEYWEAIL